MKISDEKQTTQRPWYLERTMILVLGILLSSVVSGISMLVLGINTADGMVVSDQQYKKIKDDLRATSAREK